MPLFSRRLIYDGMQSDPLEASVRLLGRWKNFIGGQKMYPNKYLKRNSLEHGSILLATLESALKVLLRGRLIWPMGDTGVASGRMGTAPKRNSEGL